MKLNATLMLCVIKDLERHKIPMLSGEAGIGKSSWCEALAALMKTKCFTVGVNELAEKADLTGCRLIPYEKADGTTSYKQVFYPHATIMECIDYAESHPRETPILFLDEINRTDAGVTSAALSIPTRRCIGSVKLPSNIRVILAGNDKGNITSLDEASISRFVLYNVKPDTNTFLEIEDATINPHVKAVLQRNPSYIFCKAIDAVTASKTDDDDDNGSTFLIEDILSDTEGLHQITTPRTIKCVSDWLNAMTPDEILKLSTAQAVVNGIETTEFMEAVVAHCGYTNFAVLLVDEIMKDINSLSTNTLAKGPTKPSCYDQLKAQTDTDALQNYIANLNDAEKSACIVYAVCEKIDNAFYLQELCKTSTKLTPEDVTMLISQITSEQYDTENLSVVSSSNTPISAAINCFIAA